MTANEFAESSFNRDVKIGLLEIRDWEEVKNEYYEEADFYMRKPRSEWPCHVLCEMKEHIQYHGADCGDTDI